MKNFDKAGWVETLRGYRWGMLVVAVIGLLAFCSNGCGDKQDDAQEVAYIETTIIPLVIEHVQDGKYVVELTLEAGQRVDLRLLRKDREGHYSAGVMCVANPDLQLVDGVRDDETIAAGGASYARQFHRETIESCGGQPHTLRCASTRAHDLGRGDSMVLGLVNSTNKPQTTLVHAGLVLAHNDLKVGGHAAMTSLDWSVHVRDGTAEEGAADSTVGIWPPPQKLHALPCTPTFSTSSTEACAP